MNDQTQNQAQESSQAPVPASSLETVKFNFKARSIKDEQGNEISKLPKQDAVIVGLPKPTPEELIAILTLEDEIVPAELDAKGNETKPATTRFPKIKQLVLDTIFQLIRDQARSQFDDIIETFGADPDKKVTADMLDFDKLDLAFISTLEPGQRGASAVSAEEIQAFFTDYTNVIQELTGKELDRIKKHISLFDKPQRIRYNKDAQKALLDSLDLYKANSSAYAQEETIVVADRIYNRLKKWYSESDEAVTAAL